MDAVDDDAGTVEVGGQVEGPRGQGELGAPVRAHPVVPAGHLQVGEVDRLLPDRADVDDAARRVGTQGAEQPAGQRHRREIVDRPAQLVPVARQLP